MQGILNSFFFLRIARNFLGSLGLNQCNLTKANRVTIGIQICNTAPRSNHLLFADDSLVLIKASRESATSLQNVLNLYEACSGQVVNYDKSSVMFSKNTNAGQRKEVLDAPNIKSEARTERYLGLPVYV